MASRNISERVEKGPTRTRGQRTTVHLLGIAFPTAGSAHPITHERFAVPIVVLPNHIPTTEISTLR